MKIYKYELTSSNQMYISKVKMPMIRKPISVGEQNNKLFVWAEIDESDKDFMDVMFIVIPTGAEVSLVDDMIFIGTVQMSNGEVFHIYWDKDWE